MTVELSDGEYERLLHRSRLMDLAQDTLLVLDLRGVIVDVNEAASVMHGLPVDQLIGTTCADYLHPSSAEKMLKIAIAMYEQGVDTTDTMELEAFRHDGETVHIELRVSYSVADRKFYVVQRNVTDHFEHTSTLTALTEKLHAQALTDTLTGVPNRAAFDQRMAEVHETGEEAWLAMIDLDRFKTVNDTFGHVAGDAVLVAIAQRLSAAIQPGDLFARIGGDEFALVSPPAHGDDFQRRVEHMKSLVEEPIDVGDEIELTATCSIGAVQRQPGESSSSWLRRSDRQMYASKEANRTQHPVSWPSRSLQSGGASSAPRGGTFAPWSAVSSPKL